jgi:hypothetical protein
METLMPRGHQHSNKKHREDKSRRETPRQRHQPWGGLKPIITGALGEAKHHTLVTSIANKHEKKRAA